MSSSRPPRPTRRCRIQAGPGVSRTTRSEARATGSDGESGEGEPQREVDDAPEGDGAAGRPSRLDRGQREVAEAARGDVRRDDVGQAREKPELETGGGASLDERGEGLALAGASGREDDVRRPADRSAAVPFLHRPRRVDLPRQQPVSRRLARLERRGRAARVLALAQDEDRAQARRQEPLHETPEERVESPGRRDVEERHRPRKRAAEQEERADEEEPRQDRGDEETAPLAKRRQRLGPGPREGVAEEGRESHEGEPGPRVERHLPGRKDRLGSRQRDEPPEPDDGGEGRDRGEGVSRREEGAPPVASVPHAPSAAARSSDRQAQPDDAPVGVRHDERPPPLSQRRRRSLVREEGRQLPGEGLGPVRRPHRGRDAVEDGPRRGRRRRHDGTPRLERLVDLDRRPGSHVDRNGRHARRAEERPHVGHGADEPRPFRRGREPPQGARRVGPADDELGPRHAGAHPGPDLAEEELGRHGVRTVTHPPGEDDDGASLARRRRADVRPDGDRHRPRRERPGVERRRREEETRPAGRLALRALESRRLEPPVEPSPERRVAPRVLPRCLRERVDVVDDEGRVGEERATRAGGAGRGGRSRGRTGPSPASASSHGPSQSAV